MIPNTEALDPHVWVLWTLRSLDSDKFSGSFLRTLEAQLPSGEGFEGMPRFLVPFAGYPPAAKA